MNITVCKFSLKELVMKTHLRIRDSTGDKALTLQPSDSSWNFWQQGSLLNTQLGTVSGHH